MGFDLLNYDHYIVSFSGGKDSTACFLYLLEHGIPVDKIELWHQEIDGRDEQFFDWEITPDYCRKFAEAFGVRIYFQWKIGGFKRELYRENTLTAPTQFELPDGSVKQIGGKSGNLDTRRKFPQQSASISTRWCSGYLKIDVCAVAIRNQVRFRNKRTLVISGERGEESPQRALYNIFEKDRSDARGEKFKRLVDRFRPLRDWKENKVWEIIEKFRVRVHPCYYMGWGRCSCKFCIFGNKNQFASVAYISPEQTGNIIQIENDFGYTINRQCDLGKLIKAGKVYKHITPALKKLATSYDYNQPLIIPKNQKWILPAGAFGENCGAA